MVLTTRRRIHVCDFSERSSHSEITQERNDKSPESVRRVWTSSASRVLSERRAGTHVATGPPEGRDRDREAAIATHEFKIAYACVFSKVKERKFRKLAAEHHFSVLSESEETHESNHSQHREVLELSTVFIHSTE